MGIGKISVDDGIGIGNRIIMSKVSLGLGLVEISTHVADTIFFSPVGMALPLSFKVCATPQ
jgi:hypothetical protein